MRLAPRCGNKHRRLFSDDDKAISLSHLFEHREEQIAPLRRGQPRLAMVATAIYKMQVVGPVIARGMIGHSASLGMLARKSCDD
jgi:hypothetical protein